MAFNVQTAGDEAIYCKFPGATGYPTPKSGRSITFPEEGYKELRCIKNASGTVIWAHKWNMTISDSSHGNVTASPGFRVKNGNTITLTASANSGYVFSKWSDNVTTNPRTITMTEHKSLSAVFEYKPKVAYYKSEQDYINGKDPIYADRVQSGTAPVPYIPTISGISFVSWTAYGTTPAYGQPITADAVYIGSWTATMRFASTASQKLPITLTANAPWNSSSFMAEIKGIKVSGSVTHHASPTHTTNLTLKTSDGVTIATFSITVPGQTTTTITNVTPSYFKTGVDSSADQAWTMVAGDGSGCSAKWDVDLTFTYTFG